jgi:hypothetical protein
MDPLNAKFVTITVEDRKDHLYFRLTGKYDYQDFMALVLGLRDECLRREATHAVIDISIVDGDIPGLERYNLGLRFAEIWGGRLKAAILAPRERINKLFENTAVNRYARVHVSHDEELLMAWLFSREA